MLEFGWLLEFGCWCEFGIWEWGISWVHVVMMWLLFLFNWLEGLDVGCIVIVVVTWVQIVVYDDGVCGGKLANSITLGLSIDYK